MSYLVCALIIVHSFFLGIVFSQETRDKNLISDLSIDGIVSFLSKHPEINTVDSLLTHLPDEFKKRGAYAFSSRSAQVSSPSHPRVILYSKNAEFILAFTGAETGNGSDKIEMIEFNKDKKQFELGSYSFASNATPKYSGKNPQQCLSCHERQGSARPIWEQYNTWPGFYGQNQSVPNQNDAGNEESNESKYFAQFLDTLKSKPGRFASLFKEPRKVTREQLLDAPHIVGSAMEGLSDGVTYNNFLRIYEVLKQHPNYEKFKFALSAAMLWCHEVNDIQSYLPEIKKKNLPTHLSSVKMVQKDSEESFQRFRERQVERSLEKEKFLSVYLVKKDGKYDPPNDVLIIPAIRYVLLSEGMEIYDWFLQKEKAVTFWSVDQDQLPLMTHFVFQDVLKERPELKKFIRIVSKDGDTVRLQTRVRWAEHKTWQEDENLKQLCDALKKESRKAFEMTSEEFQSQSVPRENKNSPSH